MSVPRLRADIWVRALIRRCSVEGVTAVVARRGEAEHGSVLIKLNTLDGRCTVLSPTVAMDGGRMWLRATGAEPVPESDAEAYVARQLKYDPDIWVLEIEDRHGRHFLDEPVE